MRACLWRLGRLGQRLLLLAVLLFILFALSSYIKEPNTKPSRVPAPRNSSLDTQPTTATAHTTAESRRAEGGRAATKEQSRAPSTARTVSPRSQQRTETVGSRLSPRSQDQGTVSHRTSLDSRTTKGRGRLTERPTATRTVSAKPQGKATTRAGTPTPGRQVPTTPRARSTQRGPKGVSTAAVPPRKTAQTPPRSARPQGPTTQQAQRLQATNFKSQPEWDFEDEYSVDNGSLQTTCPDSVKVKAARSPWLRSLFLPNLTLFLDSSRFNQSEWDRLEHFAPPFGFMELNYSVVRDVVAHFPRVPQQQLLLAGLRPGGSRCATCAVVGNGGILNNSRKGQEIDSHDYVFRLSGAVIKDYEQDVGTRTSFYGFTAFSLTQSLLILGSRGFKHVPMGKDVRYLHFLEGSRDFDWLEAFLLNEPLKKKSLFWFSRNPRDVFPKDLQLDRYLLPHPDLLRYMKNRFLRSNTLSTARWRIYRPTTGALLLLTALQLCDQVSAYGFITEGHERFSDHYYDKTWKKTVFYINHDFALEKKVWKRLHDEGIIRLYQRPVTPKPKS
ncbi:alpha-N-acetylgalactosaminide alpha-2,6-sialyltransferase 1 [Talpa occidentalis]|uniref:alpha-N-acetylgalactosaminide alpha-2,6-sialyltransferase 1 n=1 Tax=Talpa occidentalis TaxID=50954 RepID=UPI00188E33EA|nr:alpha-N-acetylgalactosaminide alpha-2,6-sialyltransferase 1 [Talpa occidentalis]